MLRGVIQHPAHRVVGTTHNALHAVGCANKVAFVDALGATGPYKDVFVVVGHANYFVGHYLTNAQDEVVLTFHQHLIHLGGPVVGDAAVGNFSDVVAGNYAQGNYIVAPVVHPKQIVRHLRKHIADFFRRHGHMRPQCRQNIGELVAVVFPGMGSYFSGLGVQTGIVWRYRQHLLALAQLIQGLMKGCPQIVRRQLFIF